MAKINVKSTGSSKGQPDNTNPEHSYYLPIWNKCSDSTEGQEAVKKKTTTYLPKLPAQANDKNEGDEYYNEYLQGAVWYAATGRTVDLLRGLPFRKPPVYSVPESMEQYINSLSADNKSAEEFAKKLVRECIIKFRCGVLLDFPNVETKDLTVAEVEAMNIKPYATIYTAENILDWRTSLINNVNKTSFISLQECINEPDPSNEFEYIQIRQVRVLDLDEGIYRVRVYKERKSSSGRESEFLLIDEYYPLVNGQTLDYIPFIPVTGDGETWDLRTPIINDLANLNIAHYRNDASYRNGLLMAGNPTACFIGLDIENSKDRTGKIRMGSHAALHLQEGGQAFYMQVGTEGFGELNRAGKDLQNQMAIIGARILSEDKKAAETSETTAIKHAGENSILSDLVNSVSFAITKILKTIADWTGIDGSDITYAINTDFLALPIDAQTLTGMLASVQSGLLSPQTFFYNLKKGEIIPPQTTYEEEVERISAYIGTGEESLDDI